MKYTMREVVQATGINPTTFASLMRNNNYSNRKPKFIPDYVSKESFHRNQYSERDVAAIKEYMRLKKEMKDLQDKVYKVLRTKSIE